MAAHDRESPELVRVKLCLSKEAPKQQAKIKRATKRHELVEVEDFVFRRKRKAVAPSPAAGPLPAAATGPGQQGSSPAAAAIRQGLQLDAASPKSGTAAAAAEQGDTDAAMTDQAAQEDQSPADAEQVPAAEAEAAAPAPVAAQADDEQQQLPEQELELGQQDATTEEAPLATAAAAAETPPAAAAETPPAAAAETPAAAAEPAQFSVAPSELCDLVEWVFLNERKKLPGTTADAARTAAAQFRQAFSEQLQQHAAAKAAGAEAAAAGGGQQEQAVAPQLTVLPYLVEQQKAALQDKRAKLLQEEAHWLQLQQQYNDMHTVTAGAADAPKTAEADAADAEAADTPLGGAAAAAAAAPLADGAADKSDEGAAAAAAAGTAEAAAGEAAAAAAAAAGDGPVCAQQSVKVRGVQLKVEMLLALVSKMEHLVASAETAARTLQAGYHAEKFKVFPHINSPAALIKSIIGSQHAAEAPGEGDGAGPSSGH